LISIPNTFQEPSKYEWQKKNIGVLYPQTNSYSMCKKTKNKTKRKESTFMNCTFSTDPNCQQKIQYFFQKKRKQTF